MKPLIFVLIFAMVLADNQVENDEVFASAKGQKRNYNEDIICPGNRFLFLSNFDLGLQKDLNQTFLDIRNQIKIDQVIYKEQIFRTYKIFNVRHNLTYQEEKQYTQLTTSNVLRVTGGTLKIQFDFQWQKNQLGSSLSGSGTGSVTSDILTYEKTMYTNTTHEIQWKLTKMQSFSITNGISIKNMDPYRAIDQQVLSQMLNKLKTNQTTIKDHFLTSINNIYSPILKQKVLLTKIYDYDKTIPYMYNDYRGPFSFIFKNTLMNSTLTEKGLELLFSQVIIGDQQFQCGPIVQLSPDPKYGGLQEFISNSLIKSSLRYTIKNGSLDVILNQQFWQSRAFQFFMGDLHEVMPASAKKIQSLQQITGKCAGLDDPVFTLSKKTDKSYLAKVNFACRLTFNGTSLISINIVANYEIQPFVYASKVDFTLTSISGTPQFLQVEPFKIEYPELAEFMVAQTLALAKGGNVIGTGYKVFHRKFPLCQVRQNALFMYDSSARTTNIFQGASSINQ